MVDRRKLLAGIVALYALLVAFRLATPDSLDYRDQAKQGLYVVDMVQRGELFLPRYLGTEPATKPPLYNWVAAAASLAAGGVTETTIRVPAILSGLGLILVTFLIGELLLSRTAAWCGSLILLLSPPFARLCVTARTDMLLAFLMALSIYAFLRAYRAEGRATGWCVLMYLALGLGVLTKGPVALLGFLVVVLYLAARRDLKALKSLRPAVGALIVVGMTLSWFVPAMMSGGREFFYTVILDEMANRFFGMGARASKGGPSYMLVGEFAFVYLPWSLYVPGALVRFWRRKDPAIRAGLTPLVVWFVTILVFFSICSQVRHDYLMPIYPAISLLVAELWVAVIAGHESKGWSRYLSVASVLAVGVAALTAGALVYVASGAPLPGQLAATSARRIELLDYGRAALRSRAVLLGAVACATAAVAVVGVHAALTGRKRLLLGAVFVAALLGFVIYYCLLDERALTGDGPKRKAFAAAALTHVSPSDDVRFCRARASLSFYLKRNLPPLSLTEAAAFLRQKPPRYLITRESCLEGLPAAGLDLVVLERSDHLFTEDDRYVLVSKAAPTP